MSSSLKSEIGEGLWQTDAILNNKALSKKSRASLLNYYETCVSRGLNFCEAKVYYLQNFIGGSSKEQQKFIQRSLTKIPQICINSDKYIQLQNGSEYTSYKKALKAEPDLLTYDERIKSRRKVIVTTSQLFGYGGYPKTNKHHDLKDAQEIVVLSAAGAQLDVAQLDYKLYCNAEDGTLKEKEFQKSLQWDVYLWLYAIELYFSSKPPDQRAHVRIPGVGSGFFARTPNGTDLGSEVRNCLVKAFAKVLKRHIKHFLHIAHYEFVFFDEKELEEKDVERLHKIARVSFTMNDICTPLPNHQSHRTLVVINPSDSFSLVANELGYQSVEAEIGNNTTIRFDQNYLHNPALVKSKNLVPIMPAH